MGADITEVTRIVEQGSENRAASLCHLWVLGVKPDPFVPDFRTKAWCVWTASGMGAEENRIRQTYIRPPSLLSWTSGEDSSVARPGAAEWRQLGKNQKPNQAGPTAMTHRLTGDEFLNYSASEKGPQARASERKRRAAVLRPRLYPFLSCWPFACRFISVSTIQQRKKQRSPLVFAQNKKAKADSLTRVEKRKSGCHKGKHKRHTMVSWKLSQRKIG